jgi:hypothetical protein
MRTLQAALIHYQAVPTKILEGLYNYGKHGYPLGGFLTAVVCNDLREACMRADDVNRHLIFEIVNYIYNEIPAPSWGSSDKVQAWLLMKQLEREATAKAKEEAATDTPPTPTDP